LFSLLAVQAAAMTDTLTSVLRLFWCCLSNGSFSGCDCFALFLPQGAVFPDAIALIYSFHKEPFFRMRFFT
jgi:hypothetical protein